MQFACGPHRHVLEYAPKPHSPCLGPYLTLKTLPLPLTAVTIVLCGFLGAPDVKAHQLLLPNLRKLGGKAFLQGQAARYPQRHQFSGENTLSQLSPHQLSPPQLGNTMNRMPKS